MRTEQEIRRFRKQFVGAMHFMQVAGRQHDAEHYAMLIGVVDYCLGDKEPPGLTDAEARLLEQAADAALHLQRFELN